MDHDDRVVVLIDMDCFYCQVEEKLNPELKGKPIAVVQYNPWKGGGIIAVNYVARAMGVTRHMRGDEAKDKCPEIRLPSVPCLRGKADITKYRDAGKEVAKVLQTFTSLLERASIDEAYLDITAPVQERLRTLDVNTVKTFMMVNTFALGYDSVDEFLSDVHLCGADSIDFDYEHAKRLLVGAIIVSEIRAAVYEQTGYSCSAGIAHNKILAKLVCGMNKPNKQTILPKHSIAILYQTLPVKKVKHLGGKFGDTVCEMLRINTMAELQRFTEKELQAKFDEKNGTWLYNIARGTDLEPVQARFNPKSIGCCKQFRGKAALLDLDSLKKWLRDLGDEIDDRLEKDALENNRTPKQMVVSFSTQLPDGRDTSSSRSYNFVSDDELCGELFSNKALELVMESSEGCRTKDAETNRKLKAPIKFLGISVGKFEDHCEAKKSKKIKDYFCAGSSKELIDINTDRKQVLTKQIGGNKHANDVMEEQNSAKKNNAAKKNDGKEYILNEFLKVSDKNLEKLAEQTNFAIDAVVESSLYKQESFFAKVLNGKIKQKNNVELAIVPTFNNESETKASTPACDIIKCGEDSNDTEYSSSTINDEINQSIALFNEDPQDIARISNMREMLNHSESGTKHSETSKDVKENTENTNFREDKSIVNDKIDTFDCSECGKTVPMCKFEFHSDYHLALKLRDEERQLARKTKEAIAKSGTPIEGNKAKPLGNCNKNEAVLSITNFFKKLNDSVPTEMCAECGKKVAVDKFAEHLDFHEAQRLSRELNKKVLPSFTGSSVKRKRKLVSPVKKPKTTCKSIDSFFVGHSSK